MNTPIDTRIYRFQPDRLDPVAVYVEQFGEEASRIVVQCYGRAWTAYWGSHGENPVEQFVCDCHAEYVANNLTWGLNGLILKRLEKHEYAYLLRVVQAIQNYWRPLFKDSAMESINRHYATPQPALPLRCTSDGALAECPCCGSLDVGGAHDTVSCYGCGLTIKANRPLQNAIDAWNKRTTPQPAPDVLQLLEQAEYQLRSEGCEITADQIRAALSKFGGA